MLGQSQNKEIAIANDNVRVEGSWDFTQNVINTPPPTLDTHLANKGYVDSRTVHYGGIGQEGQRWYEFAVPSQRQGGIWYTNTEDKPIMLYMITKDIYIDGIHLVVNNSTNEVVSFIIPRGSSYKTTYNPTRWLELR